MLKQLDAGQRDYARALRDLWLEGAEAHTRSWRDYQLAVQAVQQEYQETCTEAAAEYSQAQQAEPSDATANAYDDYVVKVQKAGAAAQDEFANAEAAYRDVTAKFCEDTSQAYRTAFLDYVRVLRSAFSECDEHRVQPDLLFRAAQGMLATSQWASATPAANPLAASQPATESTPARTGKTESASAQTGKADSPPAKGSK